MRVLGIDYGISGAFALIDTETKECFVWDMPLENKEIDPIAIDVLLCSLASTTHPIDAIWAEHVIANGPNAGRNSIMQQGKNIGKAEGIVILFAYNENIPFMHVNAQRWERHAGLWGKSKKDSCAKAAAKYPTIEKELYGPRGGAKDGRGDALLIADYGVVHHEEITTV
jgi:hypothetical protein